MLSNIILNNLIFNKLSKSLKICLFSFLTGHHFRGNFKIFGKKLKREEENLFF